MECHATWYQKFGVPFHLQICLQKISIWVWHRPKHVFKPHQLAAMFLNCPNYNRLEHVDFCHTSHYFNKLCVVIGLILDFSLNELFGDSLRCPLLEGMLWYWYWILPYPCDLFSIFVVNIVTVCLLCLFPLWLPFVNTVSFFLPSSTLSTLPTN